MSISKYQVFLKTVSCGSFSKAAEALNFTQSGISHAINSLENELGVKLLSRNRGGVVLTADGRAVLPKIEKLCAAHHSLMQTVEGLKDMDSGLVKIATFSSVKKHENTSCNTDKNAVPIRLCGNEQTTPQKCILPRNKYPLAKRRGVHHNSTRSPRKVNRLTGLKRCGVSVKVGMWVKVPANRSL